MSIIVNLLSPTSGSVESPSPLVPSDTSLPTCLIDISYVTTKLFPKLPLDTLL